MRLDRSRLKIVLERIAEHPFGCVGRRIRFGWRPAQSGSRSFERAAEFNSEIQQIPNLRYAQSIRRVRRTLTLPRWFSEALPHSGARGRRMTTRNI